MKKLLTITISATFFWISSFAQEKIDLQNLKEYNGFIDFYWDVLRVRFIGISNTLIGVSLQ